MIRFLIYRPTSVVVIYLALALLALLSLQRIPISLLPDIDIPQVSILVEQRNYSAQEIEQKILHPLRQQLIQMDGIESLEGMASHETGLIRLRFEYGRNIDYAFLEVNEKVDQSLNMLPREVSRPRVVKASVSELPAFYLSLSFQDNRRQQTQDFVQLTEFADQVLRRRLEQLNSIVLVDISGGSSQQINIQPNEQLLNKLSITQADIQAALEMANVNLGSIVVRERAFEYLVRLGQQLHSIQDVKNTALRIGTRVFTIADLATVQLEERPTVGAYFSDEHRAISLAIIKNSTARTKTLQEEVKFILDQLSEEYPDIRIGKSRDQLFLLTYSLQNLQQSLLLGAVLATVVVFLFYRRWQVALIIILIIPLSVLLSLLFFDLFGLSLNIVSLSGLILGLGLMIDNGIIILDNISQFHLKGATTEKACVKGTNEVIRPLLSSMLTTCSVFLPLVFLSGISGALFYAQALAVSIGLVISYIVAITLLPVLYFSLYRGEAAKLVGTGSWLQRLYDKGFVFTFRFPGLILLISIILVVGAIWVAQQLTIRQLPNIPQSAFELYVDWNENISPKAAQERLEELFRPITEDQLHYNAHIGQQQYLFNYDPLQKAGTVHLYVQCEQEQSKNQVQQQLRELIRSKFPAASFLFLAERTIFEQLFPTTNSEVEVGLLISRLVSEVDVINQYQQLSTAFKAHFPNGELQEPLIEDFLLLSPKEDRLLFYEIDYQLLFKELKRVLGSYELMNLEHFNQSVPIVISGPDQGFDALMQSLQITNRKGKRILLRQLISIERRQSFKHIYSSLNGQYLPLKINRVNLNKLLPFLREYERKHTKVSLEYKGGYFERQTLFQELLLVFVISVLLLYVIMAAQFESLLQPIIILLEIPISIGGCLFMLAVGGASLNVMAFIGIVVTAGIIINDSIIKIDTINRLRLQEKLPTLEAIHLGGKKRLHPIIMTSLTSILAVVPFLWGTDLGASLQRPLALALTGGLLFGTLVSLFFIPLIYSFFYKNRSK